MSVDRTSLLEGLRTSLKALSEEGATAISSVPQGSCRPDELALDYDNFLSAVLGNFVREFTPEQVSALRHVDDLLSAMSGPAHRDLWTEEAVCSHVRWREVRSAAQGARSALKWK
jgi:hypothetical protein